MKLSILIQFAPEHTKLKLILGSSLILTEDLRGLHILSWCITILLDAIHTQSFDLLWQYLKASEGDSLLAHTIQRLKLWWYRYAWKPHELKKENKYMQKRFSDCLDLKLFCERDYDMKGKREKKEHTRKGRAEYNK